jgi:hypothetical protein
MSNEDVESAGYELYKIEYVSFVLSFIPTVHTLLSLDVEEKQLAESYSSCR